MNAIAYNITQIVLGLLLFTSIIVYSIVHLANFILTKMEGFVYATEWQIGTLTVLLVLSIASIRFILKGAGNGSFLYNNDLTEPDQTINYPKISLLFAYGVFDGIAFEILKKRKARKENNEV